LKGQIVDIQKDISQKEARVDAANASLRESEKAISSSNRTLRELGDKKQLVEKRLTELRREHAVVSLQADQAEALIAQISQAQFVNSRRHPWQAAISGNNPNDISRMSAILQYMAREQDRTVDRLAHRRQNIESVTEKTNATQIELSRIVADEQNNRRRLEQEKTNRETALNDLKRELSSQRARYEQLVKNDRQLTDLIAGIDRQIKLAEEAEAKRRALLAEQQKKAKQTTAKAAKSSTSAPARTISEPTAGSFARMRGKLSMPTRGTIVAKFGQKRDGAASDLSWRGLLIQAKQGQNVVATARGTVVFSDWMRGFGNLMILDHGSNYLSVYANNESLYKSVGDKVRQGETIASVGKSGGEDTPGLYFELRYKGKPFDPAHWLAGN
ncbi:MAG: murein hydrolase activator EnvC family protein, partial [Duodenibacillus sp.]